MVSVCKRQIKIHLINISMVRQVISTRVTKYTRVRQMPSHFQLDKKKIIKITSPAKAHLRSNDDDNEKRRRKKKKTHSVSS